MAKIGLSVINGLLEEGSELLELVSVVQKLVQEEFQFLLEISGQRAQLMDSQHIPEDKARYDSRCMTGVWWQVEM